MAVISLQMGIVISSCGVGSIVYAIVVRDVLGGFSIGDFMSRWGLLGWRHCSSSGNDSKIIEIFPGFVSSGPASDLNPSYDFHIRKGSPSFLTYP